MKKKSILLGKSKRVKRKFQGLNLLLELLNSIKVSGNWVEIGDPPNTQKRKPLVMLVAGDC